MDRTKLADLVAIVHNGLIPYSMLGWVVPNPTWLRIHIGFLVVMVVHWRLNRDVCILSNLETYLRHGEWWRKADSDQGSWVTNRIRAVTGWTPPPEVSTALTYVALITSGLASLIHLWRLD